MGTPRIAIIVRYGLNASAWRDRYRSGEVVDPTPYAYHLADEWFDLEWSTDKAENRVGRAWRLAVRRILGFDFVHVWRNRDVIRRADVVWTHTEREHLGVALLTLLRPRTYRAITVAQSVWLWDLWPNLSRLHTRLFAALLRRHDAELVLSRVNRDIARSAVPGRQVVSIPFGTHFATASAGDRPAPQPPRVLTIGNDRHRDWDLLLDVSRRLPHVDFDIVSLADGVRDMEWPSNVRLRSATQREVLEEVYAEATIVALPLKSNRHASGCTVAIEAISAGLPMVATDTGGIDDYVRDSGTVLVGEGDVDRFAAAVDATAHFPHRPQGDIAAQRGLSERDYVRRLAHISMALLTQTPIGTAATAFASVPALGTSGAAADDAQPDAEIAQRGWIPA